MKNIYKVYVDTGKDFEVWTVSASTPRGAMKVVLGRTNYGKSNSKDTFSISTELFAKNMNYAEYRAKYPKQADPDIGFDRQNVKSA